MQGHRVLCCKDEVVGADPAEVRKGRNGSSYLFPSYSFSRGITIAFLLPLLKKYHMKKMGRRERRCVSLSSTVISSTPLLVRQFVCGERKRSPPKTKRTMYLSSQSFNPLNYTHRWRLSSDKRLSLQTLSDAVL